MSSAVEQAEEVLRQKQGDLAKAIAQAEAEILAQPKHIAKQDFDAWMALTRFSERKWVLDLVRKHNNGELLWYKGGINGIYIWITPVENSKSEIAVGEYKGAIPHIMEAWFTPKHSRIWDGDVDDAAKYVLERLGVAFLLDWLC